MAAAMVAEAAGIGAADDERLDSGAEVEVQAEAEVEVEVAVGQEVGAG